MQIFKEIFSDLRAMDQNRSAMRWFGLLLGAILVVIAGIMVFAGSGDSSRISLKILILAGLGGLSWLLALVKPEWLRPVNTVLLVVSLIIGWIMTRIVLILLFFGMFLPVGILLRLAGKDSMRLKFESGSDSYWIHRSDEPFDPARCRRLF